MSEKRVFRKDVIRQEKTIDNINMINESQIRWSGGKVATNQVRDVGIGRIPSLEIRIVVMVLRVIAVVVMTFVVIVVDMNVTAIVIDKNGIVGIVKSVMPEMCMTNL